MFFLGGQRAPGVGEVGEDEDDADADEDGDGAFDDVEPLPGGEAAFAGEAVEDAGGDEVAEGAGDEGSGVEDGVAFGEFFSGGGLVGGLGAWHRGYGLGVPL